MKEVILCSFAVVLAAGAYLLTANKTSEGALLLSNVEALTRDEGGQYEYPDGYMYSSICGVQISKGKKCKVEIITCQGGGSGCNSKRCPTHKS